MRYVEIGRAAVLCVQIWRRRWWRDAPGYLWCSSVWS